MKLKWEKKEKPPQWETAAVKKVISCLYFF